MIEWTFIIKTTIALIAIVDPIGCLPLFLSLTGQHKKINKKNVVKMTAITVFIILVTSLFLGDKILNMFGISMPSFQICGGILLLIMAISMMLGKHQVIESGQNGKSDKDLIAFVPLSIPLLAGPGAMSNMIIAAHQAPNLINQSFLILPCLAVSLLIWLTLSFAENISRVIGAIGTKIITRVMGLLLGSMAIEFITRGILDIIA
ncbi:NAAT family transporter [Candidatus Methylopumilus universalis]|jgi:multiple antibiotic resistance protein|uniref:MarC family protein n=1 Tax=Candidatus Methylopumilus TaxID=1679002 RepID=UPI001122F0C5|nr:MarC family protein [Candidatus Methylopumilus universalis]MBP6152576.1 NAAT family transporter [Candidatus Methylopumilus sp.]MBP7856059.1 NAAT family transporter [Candidatus Methylopumilus sp.]QDC88671.1 NAAT family transporter [Candidatus Methylopumilus universalis]QDC89962.1 NAAT family transporter [Candidatus Methylopumilus universalis]